MLDKLNQYRQNFAFPFHKKSAAGAAYKFEWIEDLQGLQEAQRFRSAQFSQQFGIQFEAGLDQDLYDFSCEHAVLRDKWSNEIIAYTRLKLFQGHELYQSYSYQEFKIGAILRLAREEAGLTQAQLADKLNTKKTAISRMENHAEDIKISTLEKFARALGKTLRIEVA